MHDLLERLAPDVDVDAGWEEVSARLGQPEPGRTPRILAVTAAYRAGRRWGGPGHRCR